MKININIRPSTKEVLKTWAERYTNNQISPIVDALIEYAGENYGFVVPGKVSSRTEAGRYTIHMYVEINNEDYIAMLEQFGKHSMKLSLSRIIEFLVNEECLTPDMFNFMQYDGTPASLDKAIDIRKFIETDQTRLMMLPREKYDIVHNIWNELFEDLWPVLNYLCIKTETNSEAVNKIREAIDIAKNIKFKV